MSDERPDETYDDVRRRLASAPTVEPRPGALERIIAAVAAEPEVAVVDLRSRRTARSQRWTVRLAAAAVVLAIVGVVVGGVGRDTHIPAVGDLVESHAAAAAEIMPDSAREMPMDDAHAMEPAMPSSMWMAAAYLEPSDTVHLVYRDDDGEVVSVFRQDGDTDVADLGDRGHVEIMGDSPVWVAVVADMHVSVIDGDGYVWTVVADHDDEAMMSTMAESLPSRSRSLLERIRDVADAVVDPWRLGG